MLPFKKISILVLFCLLLGISQAWAQDAHPLTAYRNQARALVQYLDKAQIPTGYLWDNGYAFVKRELTKKNFLFLQPFRHSRSPFIIFV